VFYPVQDWTDAEGFQEFEVTRFPENRVARPTQAAFTPKKIFLTLVSVRG
jgi:hypothetical protein